MSHPMLLGILGGMGPAATAGFYSHLVDVTPAVRDQDHVRVVMWADPTVPDRTAALLGEGESVVPWLERGVRALQDAGADLLVCPCNTAHAWLPDVAREAGVELLSIVDASADAVAEVAAPGARVGILGTDATLASGLYQDALTDRGLHPAVPTAETQRSLVEAIYEVKIGGEPNLREAGRLVTEVCAELVAAGCEVVLSGCTEVSLLLGGLSLEVPVVDSTDALARAVVRRHLAGRSQQPLAVEVG